MKQAFLTVAAVLALAACSSAPPKPVHWNPNAAPRDENWHSQTSGLLRYDANHDGTLTRAELLAGLHAEFNTYDVNHNNCLGPDQVRAINQLRVQQDGSQATPLVDWNQDGCIDFNEFSGAMLSLFDTLDKNGDGELTPKELAAAGAAPPGQNPNGQSSGDGSGHHGHHRGGGGAPPGGQ
jgi:EF hand domain-containing protein